MCSRKLEPYVKIRDDLPYIMLRKIGRGGFSSVWEIWDTLALRRRAAKLTTLQDSSRAEDRKWVVQNLVREVMLLKHDEHPSVR